MEKNKRTGGKIFYDLFSQGVVVACLVNMGDSKRNNEYGFVCYDRTIYHCYHRNSVILAIFS